jgi:hypothetical protein
MTKQEFETTDEALVMIVSVNPETGQTLFDTYPWKTLEPWLEDFKKDFPDNIHFFKYNDAAISERRKLFFPE